VPNISPKGKAKALFIPQKDTLLLAKPISIDRARGMSTVAGLSL